MNTIAILLVVGGAAYLLMRQNGGLLTIGGVTPSRLPSQQAAPIADLSQALPATPQSQNLTGALIGAGVTTGAALIGGGTAAGTGAAGAGAAGAAGGISTAAALTAAGVAAGAAVLAWAIIAKGLFRGGEEALRVNPARDAWFQYFVDAYFPGAGSSRQFEAYVKASSDAGVPGDVAERLLAAVYAADTVKEFESATADVQQQFEYYASRRVG